MKKKKKNYSFRNIKKEKNYPKRKLNIINGKRKGNYFLFYFKGVGVERRNNDLIVCVR